MHEMHVEKTCYFHPDFLFDSVFMSFGTITFKSKITKEYPINNPNGDTCKLYQSLARYLFFLFIPKKSESNESIWKYEHVAISFERNDALKAQEDQSFSAACLY